MYYLHNYSMKKGYASDDMQRIQNEFIRTLIKKKGTKTKKIIAAGAVIS